MQQGGTHQGNPGVSQYKGVRCYLQDLNCWMIWGGLTLEWGQKAEAALCSSISIYLIYSKGKLAQG